MRLIGLVLLQLLYIGSSCTNSLVTLNTIRALTESIKKDFYSILAKSALVDRALDSIRQEKIYLSNLRTDVVQTSATGIQIHYQEPNIFNVTAASMTIHIICDFKATSSSQAKGTLRITFPIQHIALNHTLIRHADNSTTAIVSVAAMKTELSQATLDFNLPKQPKSAKILLPDSKKQIVFFKIKEELMKRVRDLQDSSINEKIKKRSPVKVKNNQSVPKNTEL